MAKDPFRPAENDTECPGCGNDFGWNKEDGLAGQSCGCGYVFTGYERRELGAKARAKLEKSKVAP